ncbi:VG15 protein [Streptomyces sp. NPDC001858]
MSPTAAADRHAESRLRLAGAASRAARHLWLQTDRNNLMSSWTGLLAGVLAVVAAGQLTAAQSSEPWLQQLLGEDPDQPQSDRLNPSALVGVDGTGRPLAGVLMAPVWSALRLVTAGAPIVQAMARGQLLLDAIVRTAIADTGRAADSVAMISRPAVTSYIRVVEAGACSRCLVLAGREYGVSTAFARHPRCHCGMEPVTREHRPTAQDPRQAFDRMSDAQRLRTFGAAGAKAIAEGADLAQVVNARRGMASATVEGRRLATTTEGSVRGEFRRREFRRLQGEGAVPRSRSIRGFRPERARLMPEEIFRIADDRAHAVRLLRLHGYLY